MREIIFDTETTGLSPQEGHRLVEIGALEMRNGAATGRTFHVYINPERDMPEEAYRVHKISGDFLMDKPVFADPKIGPAFREFVGDATLVAHNAKFDMGFVQYELERAGLPALNSDVVDTVAIARRRFPGSPASLDALCARFNIDTAQRERDGHGALLDARLLAEVYIELTGGAQGGLAFEGYTSYGQKRVKAYPPNPTRPEPLPSLVTEEEAAAHAAFVAELTDPAWYQYDLVPKPQTGSS